MARFPAKKRKASVPIKPPIRVHITPILPSNITASTPLYEVQEEDVKRSNQILDILQQVWPRALDIDDICKLSLTTSKVLESRRKLLNQRLGKDSDDNAGFNKTLGVYDGD